jgi:hypothetical protein
VVAARTLAARSRAQREQATRLRRGLDGVTVTALPFVFADELSAADLQRLAREAAP